MGGCTSITLSLMGWYAVDNVILCGSAWWLRSRDRQNLVSSTKILRICQQHPVNPITRKYSLSIMKISTQMLYSCLISIWIFFNSLCNVLFADSTFVLAGIDVLLFLGGICFRSDLLWLFHISLFILYFLASYILIHTRSFFLAIDLFIDAL